MDEGRDEQDDEKGRQNDAQRGAERPRRTGLRGPDERCHIDGQRPRGGLRHRNKTQKLRLLQPAVEKHFLPDERDHAVAAAKGDGTDFQKRPEQLPEHPAHLPPF